ncbi:MAG: hypothetical protein AB7P03_07035 [Kofleriaceae bacterium]
MATSIAASGATPAEPETDVAPPRDGVIRWAVTVGLLTFTLSVAVAALAVLVKIPVETRPGTTVFETLSATTAFAPAFDTLIGQSLTITIVGWFTNSTAWKVWVSALVFGLLHIGHSPATAVVVALTSGPLLAYTCVRWERSSPARAYFATTLTDLVHNGCAYAIGLLALVS